MDFERASVFLPTIKCSMCAADIEISQMGDHVCGEPREDSSVPASVLVDESPKSVPSNGPGFLKPGRNAPPMVDITAANRPFFRSEELTPAASTPGRSASPPSHDVVSQPPFRKPLRSATSPFPGSLPSPEALSSNLDCAFSPFPTPKQPNNKPRFKTGLERFAEADPIFAPMSPRTVTAGGVLKRMNTIAPGPFDVNGRRKFGSVAEERVHKRQPTTGSIKDISNQPDPADSGANIQRPQAANSMHSRTSTSSSGLQATAALPKQPTKDSYGGFGRPAMTSSDDGERPSLRPEQRSATFPLSSSNEPVQRRPSEAAAGRQHTTPSTTTVESNAIGAPFSRHPRELVHEPDSAILPLPNSRSLSRPRPPEVTTTLSAIPANLDLAAEFGIGNPYHTPSESQSSNASDYSHGSKTSSRSSPPSARAERRMRGPSETAAVTTMTPAVQASMIALQPQVDSVIEGRSHNNQSPTITQHANTLDPSMVPGDLNEGIPYRTGRTSPVPTRNPARLASSPKAPQTNSSGRPPASKGNCRGCGEVIRGKSISSADGRLSGRYHKQCFVCTKCAAPFQTATFYVYNDRPFCEDHYHEANGSICVGCGQGIEGQYLATEKKQKYHPGCLTCFDCRRPLRSDYFEMNDNVFCEQDAFRRAQQIRFLGPAAGGSDRMERRTTRLMMMNKA